MHQAKGFVSEALNLGSSTDRIRTTHADPNQEHRPEPGRRLSGSSYVRIRASDLDGVESQLLLFSRYVRSGLFKNSDADLLTFMSFIQLSLAKGKNPPALLNMLIRKWKTESISHVHEDAARDALKRWEKEKRAQEIRDQPGAILSPSVRFRDAIRLRPQKTA